MQETRIVNLDDAVNQIEIKLGDKSFKIARITLQIRKIYGEYLIRCGEYMTKLNEVNVNADTATQSELQACNVILTDLTEKYAIDKAAFIDKMLKLILEKNGYEYSQEWWEENSDYSMMEQFIVKAISKDDTSTTTKKKVVES